MLTKLNKRTKLLLLISNEAKFITALLGGFSLTLLTVPSYQDPTWVDHLSMFFSAVSSIFLIISAYAMSFISGVANARQQKEIEEGEGFKEPELAGIVGLVTYGVFFFFISLLLVGFKVSWSAGLGILIGFVLIGLIFTVGKHKLAEVLNV